VAFIGAGGKTTSVLVLCDEATARGLSVVVTTTTKIWPPEGMPLVLQADEPEFADRVAFELNSKPCVAVGSRIAPGGKLVGLQPDEVCALKNGAVADVVLCEADGAAGRSLKVHGPGEPVVPPCATAVAVFGGLDAIGEAPGPGVIHRYDRFLGVGEADATTSIDASRFARMLLLATEKIARHVPVVYVLNKADDEKAQRDAGRVAEALVAEMPRAAVVVTSHLGFLQRQAAVNHAAAGERDAHVIP
jgi:probable selenium-dependent hydroxylase accessory protein YqeC